MTLYGITRPRAKLAALTLFAACALSAPLVARAGAQAEEHLAASVVSGLQRAIGDNPVPRDYADRQAPLARILLAKAGVRLAWLLNTVLK